MIPDANMSCPRLCDGRLSHVAGSVFRCVRCDLVLEQVPSAGWRETYAAMGARCGR